MYSSTVRARAIRLLESGESLNAVSKDLGISRATLRDWRDHGVVPRGARTCPVGDRAEDLDCAAYSLLLGYYLGDGCISRVRSSYSLRVSCDRRYPGIVADVTGAISAVHPGGSVCRVAAPGTVVVQGWWKHWPCLFPQHGPGRKHERSLHLADWQRVVIRMHPGEFLRGLFHSDGCRTNNWATRMVAGVKKRYDYPRWQFVNESPDIRLWCTETLDLLEIGWRQSSRKCISVSTSEGVARLDELIGPKC